jgi:DNA-binding HxlR family transcriptional regulator
MVQKIVRADNEIEEFHIILNQVLGELKYPRRKEILKKLPPGTAKTFEELKNETDISTGSLHHHLTELCNSGLVARQESWPYKFERSKFLMRLIDLAENN